MESFKVLNYAGEGLLLRKDSGDIKGPSEGLQKSLNTQIFFESTRTFTYIF